MCCLAALGLLDVVLACTMSLFVAHDVKTFVVCATCREAIAAAATQKSLVANFYTPHSLGKIVAK